MCASGKFASDSVLGQTQHALARVHAIDLDAGMTPKQFAEESSIPLPDDERSPRCADLAETSDPGPLQGSAKSDRFQNPIRRRNGIEAHNAIAIIGTIGVSKTRSASAARRSVSPVCEFSNASKNALPPTQARSGAADGEIIAMTNAATPSESAISPECRAIPGCLVAIETFPWARSRSCSQRAMLMQLSAQRAAKNTASAAKPRVTDFNTGNKATSVPAAKSRPITSSFAGSERQIRPSGWFKTR